MATIKWLPITDSASRSWKVNDGKNLSQIWCTLLIRVGHLQYQVTICSRNGGTNWFCILASHLNPSMIHSRYEHHQKIGVPHLLLSVIFHPFPLGEDLEYFKEDRFYPACVVMDEATVGSSENMWELEQRGINGGKPSDRQRLFMTWGFSPNSHSANICQYDIN